MVTTYGMTETCGGCVYEGLALDGVRLAMTADGRVQISGPVLARGYRLRPDLTAEAFTDGWFTSADVGRIDPDGRLEVCGRADDVAVSGGVNVPLQPSTRSSVTTLRRGCGDRRPQMPTGVSGWSPSSSRAIRTTRRLESVRAYVMRRAPAAYAPKSLVIADSLPVLPSGKVRPKDGWLNICDRPLRPDAHRPRLDAGARPRRCPRRSHPCSSAPAPRRR